MKKIYETLGICNSLLGLTLLIFNYDLIENGLFALLFIFMLVFYIIMFIKYVKNKKNIERVDFVITSIYFIFLNVYFILSIINQSNNSSMFTLLYHSRFLIIPSIIYSLFNAK